MNRFKLKGYVDVPEYDNDQLLVALNIEPVSVAVDASTWSSYQKGVITSNCGTDLNHGVLLVGAGFDSSSFVHIWKIKN